MALRAVQDGVGAGADAEPVALALLSTKLGIVFFVWPIFYAGTAVAALGKAAYSSSGSRRVTRATPPSMRTMMTRAPASMA